MTSILIFLSFLFNSLALNKVKFRATSLVVKNQNSNFKLLAGMGRNLELEANGNKIYYDHMQSDRKKSSIDAAPILYLPGLFHKKNEQKTISLQAYCKKQDYEFVCADYYGVGRTQDKFAEATLSRWVEDTIAIIENVLKSQKVILVGFGVGTWISFMIAAKRPDLAKGIVALATDVDFTEELLWKKLPEDIKAKIMSEGQATVSWGKSGSTYPISKALIEDGRMNLILKDRAPNSYPVRCPVRLMHAIDDDEVPYEFALKVMNAIASKDSNVVLMKSSTHAMDNEADIHTMKFLIEEVMTDARLRAFDLRSPASG